MIRAVFFDFGGVLYKTPDREWIKRWLVLLGLARDEAISAMLLSPDESPYFQGVMDGSIPESEMWARMGKAWRLSPLLLRWMQNNAMSRKRLNREVADYLGTLRPRFRTGILSNAGTDARRMFTDIFGFHHLVDTMVISAEEGCAKPDEHIYRVALDRLGVDPGEAVFLDDLAVNIAAARKLGMHAVQFIETRQALGEIARLLDGDL
jgi:epoxide hydrolase-like predicted phosphatase